MPRTTAYAEVSDLLLGEVRLPAAISAQQYLYMTADEMDAKLGALYVIPVNINASALTAQAKLILKKINAHLATGRIIMALAIHQEDRSLHAYGKSFVDDALTMLHYVASNADGLEGAVVRTSLSDDYNGPTIAQQDDTSPLDAFYAGFLSSAPFRLTLPSWTAGEMD